MYSASISKRTFLKSMGLLAILGMIAPWLRRAKLDSSEAFPIEVRKEPNAVSRGSKVL